MAEPKTTGSLCRALVSCVAHAFLALSFGITLLVARLARALPKRRWRPTGRILLTGTFYNTNWYLSHITPLARSGVKEVILVGDEPQVPIERVRFSCPPRWLSALMTRAAAKMIWMLAAGFRYKPDLCMGYHIFPGACSVLIVARLLGRPACYQMTGGPIEILGGGIHAENQIASRLARPSAFLERLAVDVIRQFDLVIVRGSKAKAFLAEQGLNGNLAVITGSVAPVVSPAMADRPYDLIFVGRLTELKQPFQFVEIVAAVRREVPSVRAVMVGDGPLTDAVRRWATELQVDGQIDFAGKSNEAPAIMAKSKVFVLTSRSEGMSIAMAEAMAAGAVPVVANVGDLPDLVEDGTSGFLVMPNDVAAYAARITSLLADRDLWSRCSEEASRTALQQCGVDVVSEHWKQRLAETIGAWLGVAGERDR
jgi:glycosyltransferase involved in cell wall biosynthesis